MYSEWLKGRTLQLTQTSTFTDLKALLTSTSIPGCISNSEALLGHSQALPSPQEQLYFSLFFLNGILLRFQLNQVANRKHWKPLGFKAGTIRIEMKRPRFCFQLCCATLIRSPPLSEPHFSEWEMKTLDYKLPKRAPPLAGL